METASQPFTMVLPLDRVTALAMESGTRVTLRGRVTASFDGSSFDAGRLFDFAAGGLEVIGADPARFAYVVEATGRDAPACARVGSPSPCLMPRLDVLAHERLRSAAELASTLSGNVELESRPPNSAGAGIIGTLGAAGICAAAALGAAWLAIALRRRLGRSALLRVRGAARRAMRATRGDATLDPVRRQIRSLVDRARQLDALRRDCARKLGRMDRGAALVSLPAERDAAARVARDHASAVVEIARIESALRAVALRSDSRTGVSPRADLVAALVTELDLRDQAIAEADTA
jgi:hypothetical protein